MRGPEAQGLRGPEIQCKSANRPKACAKVACESIEHGELSIERGTVFGWRVAASGGLKMINSMGDREPNSWPGNLLEDQRTRGLDGTGTRLPAAEG